MDVVEVIQSHDHSNSNALTRSNLNLQPVTNQQIRNTKHLPHTRKMSCPETLKEPQTTLKFNGLTFKFEWSGLFYQNERFDPNFSKYMPKTNKNGKLSARNSNNTQRVGYWKAQCAFRGLSTKGLKSISDFQDILHGKESLKQAKELSEFERQAKNKWDAYLEKYDELEEASAQKEDERLYAEALDTLQKRFLRQLDGGTEEGIVIKNLSSQCRFKRAADTLGLSYATVNAVISGEHCDTDRWMIFGGRNNEAEKKKGEILEGFRKEKEDKERRQKEAIEKAKNQVRATHNDMIKFSQENSGAWNVAGGWKITFPYVKDFCLDNQTLEIFITPNGTEKDMWAKFDFGICAGVFRFLRQDDSTLTAGKSKKVEESQRTGE